MLLKPHANSNRHFTVFSFFFYSIFWLGSIYLFVRGSCSEDESQGSVLRDLLAVIYFALYNLNIMHSVWDANAGQWANAGKWKIHSVPLKESRNECDVSHKHSSVFAQRIRMWEGNYHKKILWDMRVRKGNT